MLQWLAFAGIAAAYAAVLLMVYFYLKKTLGD
jgi:hypothetical protein